MPRRTSTPLLPLLALLLAGALLTSCSNDASTRAAGAWRRRAGH